MRRSSIGARPSSWSASCRSFGDGLAAGEPTLVMVSRQKIGALREIIGADGDRLVEYRDMEVVGANPARIIPAWNAFAVAGARQGRGSNARCRRADLAPPGGGSAGGVSLA